MSPSLPDRDPALIPARVALPEAIRNVIDGSLRAMVRDARKAGIGAAFPFTEMDWPRSIVAGPDPFTDGERDQLLDYFLRKGWRRGRGGGRYEIKPHFPYYAFVFTLFFTGLRPSEAVALRLGSLDLITRRTLALAGPRGRPEDRCGCQDRPADSA